MKVLEKDRTRRYETANGFASDILRHLASEPVLATPPSRSYRAREFIRKHRAGVLAASLVLLALVAGIAGTTLGLLEARHQEDLANKRAEGERLARQEALKAAGGEKTAKETAEDVLGFVETKVFAAARPQGRDGGLGDNVTLADAITASLPAIRASFAARPPTEARLRRTVGNSFMHQGKAMLAAEPFETALALDRRHLGPDHPDTLESMNRVAEAPLAAGRFAEDLSLMEASCAVKPRRIQSYWKLAALQAWLGRGDGLATTRRRFLASARGADGTETLTADITGKVCSLLSSTDPAGADAAFALGRRAVDLGRGSDYLDYHLMDLGMAEYRAGHFAEADAALVAAIARPGSAHRCVRETSAYNRAMNFSRQGRGDEARKVPVDAAAAMRPLPLDEKITTAGEVHHDDLIMWLAYKEANALIGFDAPPGAK